MQRCLFLQRYSTLVYAKTTRYPHRRLRLSIARRTHRQVPARPPRRVETVALPCRRGFGVDIRPASRLAPDRQPAGVQQHPSHTGATPLPQRNGRPHRDFLPRTARPLRLPDVVPDDRPLRMALPGGEPAQMETRPALAHIAGRGPGHHPLRRTARLHRQRNARNRLYLGRLRHHVCLAARSLRRTAHSALPQPGKRRERQSDLPDGLFAHRRLRGRPHGRPALHPRSLRRIAGSNR